MNKKLRVCGNNKPSSLLALRTTENPLFLTVVDIETMQETCSFNDEKLSSNLHDKIVSLETSLIFKEGLTLIVC